MARKMQRLVAVALVCMSSVGVMVVTHAPQHGSAMDHCVPPRQNLCNYV